MSTDVRSFSRAIMADIPDAVQQHVEEVAKHVADAIRYLWHAASAHPFEFAIAVATAGIFIFAWVLARSIEEALARDQGSFRDPIARSAGIDCRRSGGRKCCCQVGSRICTCRR